MPVGAANTALAARAVTLNTSFASASGVGVAEEAVVPTLLVTLLFVSVCEATSTTIVPVVFGNVNVLSEVSISEASSIAYGQLPSEANLYRPDPLLIVTLVQSKLKPLPEIIFPKRTPSTISIYNPHASVNQLLITVRLNAASSPCKVVSRILSVLFQVISGIPPKLHPSLNCSSVSLPQGVADPQAGVAQVLSPLRNVVLSAVPVAFKEAVNEGVPST